LHRYLLQRLELIRQNQSLRAGWSKLKALPQESLRLLDLSWLRSRASGETPSKKEEEDA
jgi:hypothetical protein